MAKIDPETVLQSCADAFNVSEKDIRGDLRVRQVVHARRATAYFLKKYFRQMSSARIGRFLGGKDHTTILNAIQKHIDTIEHYPEYASACSAAENRFAPVMFMRSGKPVLMFKTRRGEYAERHA